MPPTSQWSFTPFRLDPTSGCLWRGEAMMPLRPKEYAVLLQLVTHAGQLVTKEALLAAVWPETAVSEAVLKTCLGQLRKALGDAVETPRYIITVYRRGYRFIAPVTVMTPPAPAAAHPSLPPRPRERGSSPQPAMLVERERVLGQLHTCLSAARQGQRQVVFVTGDLGMGKTAVLETFTAQAAAARVRTGWGQCIDAYGAGEAYLPVFDALDQLCRGPAGPRAVAILRQHAPTWLAQIPWLLSAANREGLRHELHGTTRERMLRELAEALTALTAEEPLVLVLEDLHWSDTATLDALAMLARRREPARLLVVGTYRPVEAIVRDHPLRTVTSDLLLHGQGWELSLAPLSAAAVRTYVAARFPRHTFLDTLAPWLSRRTEGHPLFVVKVLEHLLARDVLVEHQGSWELQGLLADLATEVPDSLQQMLLQQLDHLSPLEQRVITAASAVGAEFCTAVAAVLEDDITPIEDCCETLVRQRQLLRPEGLMAWPDGTVTASYTFQHALYQQVAYHQLGALQRVAMQRRLRARLEAAYGPRMGSDVISADTGSHTAAPGAQRRHDQPWARLPQPLRAGPGLQHTEASV